jgi:YlxR-like protein
LLRDPGGAVRVDPGGRGNGRGAYVCAERSCIDRGLLVARLSHALRKPCVIGTTLGEEVLAVRGAVADGVGRTATVDGAGTPGAPRSAIEMGSEEVRGRWRQPRSR